MIGNNPVMCDFGVGEWDGDYPTCEELVCLPYSVLAVGSIPGGDCAGGGVITDSPSCELTCLEGYTIKGFRSINIDCLRKTATWEVLDVDCVENMCPEVSVRQGLTQAGAECPGGSVFEQSAIQCEYSCAKGYSIVGSAVVTCSIDGEWGEPPTCRENICADLNFPANGEEAGADCDGGPVSESPSCELFCEEGYSISGSRKIFCDGVGMWPAFPTCTEIQCPAIVQVAKGEQAGSDRSCWEKYGVFSDPTCAFACESGYQIVGNTVTHCNRQGEWEPNPVCEEIQCEAINVAMADKIAGSL